MTAAANGQAAVEFLGMCSRGEVRAAYEQYVDAGFRHHNAWFRSDRASLLAAMEESAAREPNKSFEVMKVIAADDSVAVYSRLQRAQGAQIAVVHILRFDRGKIVEMWDIGQPVPEHSPNELGMF